MDSFLLLVYACIVVGDPILKNGRVRIPSTGLTPPHVYSSPRPRHGFSTPYVVIFMYSVV